VSAEFVLNTAVVRAFVTDVRATIAGASSPEEACEAIRLGSPSCSPTRTGSPPSIRRPRQKAAWAAASVSGSSTAPTTDRCRSSPWWCCLVRRRPIHDHLAWGFVGLYRGVQQEEIYTRRNGALELAEQRSLGPGDFYVLIPPRHDIHRVRTTSAETSVSIHLLTNDTGCIWRHAYDLTSGEARPFRSGYVNVACDDAVGTR
jgi:hypothetical protein